MTVSPYELVLVLQTNQMTTPLFTALHLHCTPSTPHHTTPHHTTLLHSTDATQADTRTIARTRWQLAYTLINNPSLRDSRRDPAADAAAMYSLVEQR